MGTRNMIGAVKDGKWVLGQYCQWDGYFSGQGKDIVEFFMNEYDKAKFDTGLEYCYFPDNEEWEKLNSSLLRN